MYRVLVPSMGRCGSTLVSEAIASALKTRYAFVRDYFNVPPLAKKQVIKTHAHYSSKPSYDYRAVYLWGNVGDIWHSLYLNRTSWGGDPMQGLLLHFEHLGLSENDCQYFKALLSKDRDEAFSYLIEGDRLQLLNNALSWRGVPDVMFVNYEALCRDPHETFTNIGEHVGVKLQAPEIKPRWSSFFDLPRDLQDLVVDNYPDWMLNT